MPGYLFGLVFLIIPAFLWADPPLLEPSTNTLAAKSNVYLSPEQPPITLPEVVVTANRVDMPLSQVANSMSVITSKDIEQKQADTALSALQGVPGLTLLQNGAAGEISGIFVRGADAGHTLVLLNGVPLNNPISTDRAFSDFDQLYVDDINQMEVLRGPLSTLYGTNATAGVVNIITQKGEGAPKGSFLFEGGAYNSFREAASASAGNDAGNIALSVSRFDTQGFPSADKSFGNTIDNADGNTTASLRFGFSSRSNLSNFDNNIFMRFVNSRTNVDAQGGANGDDPNYFVDERQWVTGSQMKWNLLGSGWEQVLGISYTDDFQKYTDDFSSYPNSHYERGAFEGQSAQLNWQNNIDLWKGETLVAGIQGQKEWGREDDTYGYIAEYLSPPQTIIGPPTFINQTTTTGSYFLESQTGLLNRLFATLGGRIDAVSSFGSQLTYRGAVAYFVPEFGTKLNVTYGTGFKAPSIYQLYSPYGNNSLQAETSEGWDAGFEQPFVGGDLKAGATYFQNDFSNLIDFESSATPPYGRYINIGNARTEGWETFASAKPIRNLELKADYTYTWAFDVQTGQQLQRRPQNQADYSTSYQWGDANLGCSLLYVGERPDLSFVNYTATPIALPAYALVNLVASYQLDKHLKLFGRINNLFNTSYEEIYGYGTPGFSVYFGTRISL